METATSPPLQIPHFGPPAKKRKFRQRRLSNSSTDASLATLTTTTTPDPTNNPTSPDPDPEVPTLSTILALRKKIRVARGLEVSSAKPSPSEKPGAPQGATVEEDEAAAAQAAADAELQAVVNRFTHQTGQILDVDKHMMAFIEAEMHKRRGTSLPAGSSSFPPSSTSDTGLATTAIMKDEDGEEEERGNSNPTFGGNGTTGAYWAPKRPEARGATLGKLHEVDLGEESKMRNIARTQEATRRLETGEEVDDAGKKKGKRRRRNSQDIQRDKLVEEVLKESRLEMYTDPEPTGQEDVEGAADDRIAEKFRREFLDALSSRRRRRGGDHRHKKKDDSKRPKGPKLGGSRMARAAMRESQAQASGSGGGKK
ncbi:hypothetical protein RUND412_000715 [Rhizina undulata]